MSSIPRSTSINAPAPAVFRPGYRHPEYLPGSGVREHRPSPVRYDAGPVRTPQVPLTLGAPTLVAAIGARKAYRSGLEPSVRGRSERRIAARDARALRRSELRARRRVDPLLDREAGMATAEYAIATLAAVGFAALLVAVLSSGEIKGLLMSLITTALNFG